MFIIWHSSLDIFSWLIVAMGILLIIPGLYNIIAMIFGRSKTVSSSTANSETRVTVSSMPVFSGAVTSVICIAFGLWMIINPGFFVGLIAYVFAALMVVYGLYQIISIARVAKVAQIPWYLYIVPALMMIAGVVILCTSVHELQSFVVLLTGILLVLVAINSMIEQACESSSSRQ